MKRPIFLLLAFLLASANMFGQCLTNGTFATACTATGGECESWTNACGDGWIKSHGSPDMIPYSYQMADGTYNGFYVNMFTGYGEAQAGEGMYTAFNFQEGTYYDLKLDFVASLSPGGNSSNVKAYTLAYAANGLTEPTVCSYALPSGVTDQNIGSYPGLTPPPPKAGEITTTTFTFQANASYSQLWIYPFATNSGYQYNLGVYRVQLCPSCTATATYTSGVLPTVVAGATITIGGAGSSVSPNPASTTTISASQVIYLKPGFQASATGSGSTVASIVPCGSNGTIFEPTDAFDNLVVISSGPPPFDSTTVTPSRMTGQAAVLSDSSYAKLLIFPTVSSGIFTIAGPSADLANTNISVFDQSGKILYSQYNATNNTIQLNLSSLSSGLYFVQIRQATKVSTQKIIVNK